MSRGHRHSLARSFDEPDNAQIVIRQCACGANVRVSHVVVAAMDVFNRQLATKVGERPLELLAIRCPACEAKTRAAGAMTPGQAQVAIDRIKAGWTPDAGTANGLVSAGHAAALALARIRNVPPPTEPDGEW